jgi:hypothetical protein
LWSSVIEILHGVAGRGGKQRPGGVAELVEQRVVLSLEPASLGAGEARGRQCEGRELDQRLLHACDALLQARRQGPEGGGAVRLSSDGTEGIAQQGGSLVIGAGCAPGSEQDQGLALLEAMAQEGVEDGLLVFAGQGAEDVGERGTDAPLSEAFLCRWSEPGREGMAAGGPSLAAPEQARGRGKRESVVADQRVDDTRLVHRREGARRGVGAQQECLAVHGGGSVLENGWDFARSFAQPAGQALEAVDDLEAAVVLGDDSQRQVGERLAGGRRGEVRSQAREARAQAADGQVVHGRRVRGEGRHDHRGR